MNGRCLFPLDCAVGAAVLILFTTPARAADQASSSAPVLQAVNATMDVHAPSPVTSPDEYRRMQANAREIVKINIVSVKTQPAQTGDKNPNAMMVTARAMVTGVTHTSTNLQVGSAIFLLYGYAPPVPGTPAPVPPALVKTGTEYLAYLSGGPGDAPYTPVAGAQSFVNPDADETAASPGVAAPATGPIADPAALPTPDNPAPAGSVRLHGDALAQFVKLIQHDGQWYVSVAGADAVSLQTIGDAKPALLVYYSAHLGAPATQPTILVYQAGIQPAPPPSMSQQTVERALIFDNTHHAIADTLWALRVEDSLKPVPLPIWHWASYKLEIEDPDTHKVQTILLSGNPAPVPVVSPPSPSPGGQN